MNRLLLTSICKPLGPRYGDAPSVGYELLHGQVTLAQGVFSPRATHLQYGLEFIAANLDTPTTVLQYPSKRELLRELKKGYEFVGISFVLSTYHRMKEVVSLIRKYSPQSKIVLGGYGTVIEDQLLKPYCDHICRTEGVGFMKNLLGEKPLQQPFKHPTVISRLKVFSVPVSRTGMVFAGLGCPNGCDFCCTSHYFRRRHIRLLDTGTEIFQTIKRYSDVEGVSKFTILDEDFLLNRRRARDFAQAVEQSGYTPSIFCFASVRAISRFTVEELISMGIDGLWIGFEGRRSGFAKQSGKDVAELFAELRAAGIMILASMIIGFDYQTPEVIQEELDYLLEQQPTLSQFLIYGPTPGTPFYDRIMKEKRLRPDLANNRQKYFHKCTGFEGMVTHPTLSADELREQQAHCFRKDFRRLGPSIVRSLECSLTGYLRWKQSNVSALRKKAEVFHNDFVNGAAILPVAFMLGPSRDARRKALKLLHKGFKNTSIPILKFGLLSLIAFPAALWTGMKLRFHLAQHPRLWRRRYPGNELNALCGTLLGKLNHSWLKVRLRAVELNGVVTSLDLVEMRGRLDGQLLKRFLRRLKDRSLISVEKLVIDIRDLEIMSDKALVKLLQRLNKNNSSVFVLINCEKMNWLRDNAAELMKSIGFFQDEELLLAHVVG